MPHNIKKKIHYKKTLYTKTHYTTIKYDDSIYIDSTNKSTIFHFLHSQNTSTTTN